MARGAKTSLWRETRLTRQIGGSRMIIAKEGKMNWKKISFMQVVKWNGIRVPELSGRRERREFARRIYREVRKAKDV